MRVIAGGQIRPVHRPSLLAAALLCSLLGAWAPAAPRMRVTVGGLPITFEECRTRIQAAFAAEGYGNVGGDFGNGWIATKDSRTAAISCIRSPSATETVVEVVVASDPQDAAVGAAEADKLSADMRRGAPSGGGGGGPATDWRTQADPLRGRNGERFTFACPAGGTPSGRLWGTDLYTDDSSICTAAVHAGLITAAGGGDVTIEIRPGAASYRGSERNGVRSGDYGGWTGSFVFAGGSGGGTPPGGGGGGQVTDWRTQADPLRGRNGQRFTFACPAGGTPSGRLWGTDLYTDYSSICTAAVHAGLITAAGGGEVTIEIRPGAASYRGSERNGVRSGDYGGWTGSFVFVGGRSSGGGGAGGGPCDDPRELQTMDEWLGQAVPPQEPGESLRYEPWGRLVGQSRTAVITAPNPPDTDLTRCEWLLQRAASLRSTNLGTLAEYLARRLQR